MLNLDDLRKQTASLENQLQIDFKGKSSQTNELKINRNVTFLLDTSGSMGWYNKIENAKKALKENARKNDIIITFSNHACEIEWDEIKEIYGDGETNLLPALKLAAKKEPKTIYIITDGEPTDSKQEIIDFVKKMTNITIHTIGIGDDCNHEFLKELSKTAKPGVSQKVDTAGVQLSRAIALLPR